MSAYTDDPRNALIHAGWAPHRKINIDSWQHEMLRDGFYVHPAAEAFLQEFGGLRVSASVAGVRMARLPLHVNPTLCNGMAQWIQGFESSRAQDLVPVGEAGTGGEATLVISRSGDVHLLCEDGEGELAVTLGRGFDALARLLTGDFVAQWRPDDPDGPGVRKRGQCH